MSQQIDTLILAGKLCITQDHPLVQRLAERRISIETQAKFQIQPHGNGWIYPIPGGGFRWKNSDSSAKNKYIWVNRKPEHAHFYYGPDLRFEIAKAGGVCWFVSGEADVWALNSAGIPNVFSGFTESQIPDNFGKFLLSMEVRLVYIAPDLDLTGEKWGSLVAEALMNSSVELDARTLPGDFGIKNDLGNAWEAFSKNLPFERYLLGLPRFNPKLLQKKEHYSPNQPDKYLTITQEYKNQIINVLHVSGFQSNGFSKRNVHCPFHDDKRPSASLHQVMGLYCHACGKWYTWNQTGIKIGVGSLQNSQLIDQVGISTELREALIKAHHTNLSRLLDVLFHFGWQSGKEFSRKDVAIIAQGLLSEKTIRSATHQLESYCPILPSFSLQHIQREKKGKKSRPPKVYFVPNPYDLARSLKINQIHFDKMNPQKIICAADYRAEVYAALPRRKPGQYSRKLLSDRVGVTKRTGQTYDKKANLIVTQNITKVEATPQSIAKLPEELPSSNRKYNLWLEDEYGTKYPPIRKMINVIIADGGGKIYLCEQHTNSYQSG